jgi:hypothetical protein
VVNRGAGCGWIVVLVVLTWWLVGVECLDGDGEEGMGEDGGVDVIPEEGMGGVGTDDGGEAGVDDVGEAEVGGVINNGLEEIERVQVRDVDPRIELLEEQELGEGLVGCQRRGGVEGREGVALGHDRQIEDVGDEEVSGAGVAQKFFVGCGAERDLEAKLLWRPDAECVDDVVASAFEDIEGVGIGLAAVLAKVERDLVGDAGDDGSAAEGLVGGDEGSAPGIVGSAEEGGCHGKAPGAGDVFDKEGAVREASVKVGRRGGNSVAGGGEEVADVAVAVAEDVDGAEVGVGGLRCDGGENEADKDGTQR